jgi:membrane peptidoglycan carboxypeptidase
VPKHIDVRRFSAPFKLLTYDAKGTPVEIELGPGAPGWVRRGDINHFIEAAVMTCEDGRFRRHQGFDHEAIRNSVRDNLRARKFLRGASTISMQLGKNLYLTRDKTISRKLQELILTTYLEQALTKDEIMGLYLNVVEFAPMTHGLGLASAHYFNAQPGSLSLSQAMYLASVLPNPKQQHFVQEGRVSDGWMRYLYKLMRIASKMRWISEQELEEGLGEWVVRGSPEPVRTALPSEESGVGADQEDEPFGWKRKDSPVY